MTNFHKPSLKFISWQRKLRSPILNERSFEWFFQQNEPPSSRREAYGAPITSTLPQKSFSSSGDNERKPAIYSPLRYVNIFLLFCFYLSGTIPGSWRRRCARSQTGASAAPWPWWRNSRLSTPDAALRSSSKLHAKGLKKPLNKIGSSMRRLEKKKLTAGHFHGAHLRV